MGDVPGITVNHETITTVSRPGMAGKVAIIGAFDSEINDPINVSNITEAYEKLGNTSTYNGNSCIPYLFRKEGGASSLLAVNITTKTGTGDNETVNTELTTAKLESALKKIKGEDFHILFIADTVNDAGLTMINTFLEESSEIKRPNGLIIPLTRDNDTNYKTTVDLFGDCLYYLNTQQLSVDDIELNLIQSTAHICGLIAGASVSKTLTMKQIDDVTALTDEYTFETGDLGKKLVNMGIPVLKYADRENQKIVCVNSELPNGYDLYINRTRDYVVRAFNLEDVLGEKLGNKGKEKTLTAIKSILAEVKKECVDTLELLEDIQYTVEKTSNKCVDVFIEDLVFAGIITHINVHIKLKVV